MLPAEPLCASSEVQEEPEEAVTCPQHDTQVQGVGEPRHALRSLQVISSQEGWGRQALLLQGLWPTES